MITLAQTDEHFYSNGNNGAHMNGTTDDTTTATPHTPSWRDHEAPFLYSVKWIGEGGAEHLVVARDESLDSLWLKAKTINVMIKAAQAKQHERSDDLPKDGFCELHQCGMRQHVNERGKFFSHKAPDGSWCHGKQAKKRD